MRFVQSFAIVIALFAASIAAADEPVLIPLDKIWALDMPGTRDIGSLNSSEDSVVDSVLRQVSKRQQFHHCFVVRGDGANALREFLRVRSEHTYWNRLPADQPLSIVFYTKPMLDGIELRAVERKGSSFTIRCRYAPRNASVPSPRLALIPIGKLSLGEYDVKIERSPAAPKYIDGGFEEPPPQRFNDVCASCRFQVVEGLGGPPPPEEIVEIPLQDVWASHMPGTRDINEFGALKAEESLVNKAQVLIQRSWRRGEGMILQGEGREALEDFINRRDGPLSGNQNAGEKWSRNEVSSDRPASIAFYSRGTGMLIQLVAVTRQGRTFKIQYRPEPYDESLSYPILALIPIGQLKDGVYRVNVEQLPLRQEYLDKGIPAIPPNLSDGVSGSFSFIVVGTR